MCARGEHAETHKACLLVWEVCRRGRERRGVILREEDRREEQSEIERDTGRDKKKRAREEQLYNMYYILAMFS